MINITHVVQLAFIGKAEILECVPHAYSLMSERQLASTPKPF